MILAGAAPRRLGVDPTSATVRFGDAPRAAGRPGPGRRLLWLDGDPAFELTFWCGTCPVTFERLVGANRRLSVPELEQRLTTGLDAPDDDVLATVGGLLPEGIYLPLLLSVRPRLVTPVGEGDYFADEQVATWGIDSFRGLPENPRTPYYRTFETSVDDDAHLYEFVVPMVPPSWNDRARVAGYEQLLADSSRPTAVAVSILDVTKPADADESADYYEHRALTHFLIDGHHKMEAAAATGREVRLLALVATEASLAPRADVEQLPALRARPAGTRQASPSATSGDSTQSAT